MGAIVYYISQKPPANKNINSYAECAAAGYPIQESFPEQCSTPDGKHFTNTSGQSAEYEGRIICLAHKDAEGPHTLECAIGLRTTDGKSYALRDADSKLVSAAGSDKTVRVTGTLESQPSDKYQSEGTIKVTDFELIK